jgi:transaldolase
MATAAQTNERLAALLEAGTSPWLDQIKRSLIEQGELERLIREDSLRGVTSNPAIFEKAILGSDDYDEDIERLAGEGLDANDIYLTLAVKDVQLACDVMRPVWEEAGGADGFVSLEVEPGVAFDTDATLRQAHELWERVDRPNVLIKIPATTEGAPAITTTIGAGISVNVTLIFGLERYQGVMEAYVKGLELARDNGKDLSKIHSVASFFVSRVDTEIDKRLEALGGHDDLLGKAGVANARLAYRAYEEFFSGDRWSALEAAGANKQRPLWASTGVKNPDYRDTMYVDDLVVANTVNTMPEKTLEAVADHGAPDLDSVTGHYDEAQQIMDQLASLGIVYDDVIDVLEREAVEKFEKSWAELLETVQAALDTGNANEADNDA